MDRSEILCQFKDAQVGKADQSAASWTLGLALLSIALTIVLHFI